MKIFLLQTTVFVRHSSYHQEFLLVLERLGMRPRDAPRYSGKIYPKIPRFVYDCGLRSPRGIPYTSKVS